MTFLLYMLGGFLGASAIFADERRLRASCAPAPAADSGALSFPAAGPGALSEPAP